MGKKERFAGSGGLNPGLNLGETLYLETETAAHRLQLSLVGVIPSAALVVQMPAILELDAPLSEGQAVQIKYVSGGEVFGFSASVLGAVETPFALTFLSFPVSVERLNVRRHPRVECYIPASLKLGDLKKSGVISDISRGGCRFQIRDMGGSDARRIDVGTRIGLDFPLLGLDGVRECSGIVRNISLDADGVSLGVEYDTLDPELSERIDDYAKMVEGYRSATKE